MACQPKGETSNRNRGFQWRLLRYPSLDPRPSPHRQPCHFLPGGGTPPTTAAPISHRQSTILYQLPAYRLVHPPASVFSRSQPALPQRVPTYSNRCAGGTRLSENTKSETQNLSKTPAIKPHQTASTGGGSRFRIGFHPPPDPSSINYHLSTLFPGASVTMLPLTFHSPPIFFSGTTALPIRAE